VNKHLHTVASVGFLFTLNYDAQNHELKKKQRSCSLASIYNLRPYVLKFTDAMNLPPCITYTRFIECSTEYIKVQLCPQCSLLLEKHTNNSFPSQLLSIPMNNVTHVNGYLVWTLQTTYITHIKKFLILQGNEKLLSTNKELDKKTQSLEARQKRGLFSFRVFLVDYLRNYL